MARLPTTLLAQPLELVGPWTCTVNDEAGAGRTVTVVAGGSTQYARPYLAKSTGTGTLLDPFELLLMIVAALNTALAGRWSIALTTDGRVRLTYNGTGTGEILAGTVTVALGFTGAVGPLATSASQTGSYPPVGLLAAFSVSEDSGWDPAPSHVAASRAADGTVVVVASPHVTMTRSFGLRFHPRTWADQPAGEYLSPAFPPDASPSLIAQPTGPTQASLTPWSVHEFVMTSAGKRLGIALATAQLHLSGATTRFDVGYFAPEVYRPERGRVTLPSQSPNWNARRDFPGLALSWVTSETR